MVISKSDRMSHEEPDWPNPANDRKTPYAEEEIDAYVEDFIRGLDDSEWEKIRSEYGEKNAREIVRAAMRSMDTNNLANMKASGCVKPRSHGRSCWRNLCTLAEFASSLHFVSHSSGTPH